MPSMEQTEAASPWDCHQFLSSSKIHALRAPTPRILADADFHFHSLSCTYSTLHHPSPLPLHILNPAPPLPLHPAHTHPSTTPTPLHIPLHHPSPNAAHTNPSTNPPPPPCTYTNHHPPTHPPYTHPFTTPPPSIYPLPQIRALYGPQPSPSLHPAVYMQPMQAAYCPRPYWLSRQLAVCAPLAAMPSLCLSHLATGPVADPSMRPTNVY